MKVVRRALGLFLLVFVFCGTEGFASEWQCQVIAETDGDTIKVLSAEKKTIRVRLARIDAPEKKQPFGKLAGKTLSGMVFGKQVVVHEIGKDKYGRTLADIYLGGHWINTLLIEKGVAWVYVKYRDDDEPIDVEQNAKKKRMEPLQEGNPIPPLEWRREKGGW